MCESLSENFKARSAEIGPFDYLELAFYSFRHAL